MYVGMYLCVMEKLKYNSLCVFEIHCVTIYVTDQL